MESEHAVDVYSSWFCPLCQQQVSGAHLDAHIDSYRHGRARDAGRDGALLEEQWRQGLLPPWMEVRQQFKYCTLCLQWATTEHLGGQNHQKKLYWFDQNQRSASSVGQHVGHMTSSVPASDMQRASSLQPRPPPEYGEPEYFALADDSHVNSEMHKKRATWPESYCRDIRAVRVEQRLAEFAGPATTALTGWQGVPASSSASAPPQAESDLPPNWRSQRDGSGKPFYYEVDAKGNAIGNSSTWDRPSLPTTPTTDPVASVASVASVAAGAAAAAAGWSALKPQKSRSVEVDVEDDLPTDWKSTADPQGRVYYYKVDATNGLPTNCASWDRPSNPSNPSKKALPSSSQPTVGNGTSISSDPWSSGTTLATPSTGGIARETKLADAAAGPTSDPLSAANVTAKYYWSV